MIVSFIIAESDFYMLTFNILGRSNTTVPHCNLSISASEIRTWEPQMESLLP